MKTIGILGGMGPEATILMYKKIMDFTHASSDQDHIPTLIDSNTNIPDRTDAILYNGRDPKPEIIKSAKRLEKMGADLIVMPCNTSHYFYDEIIKHVNIEFLNMISLTAKIISEKYLSGEVALFATSGTIASKTFEIEFKKFGLDIIYPNNKEIDAVMDLVYNGVKKGNHNLDLTFYNNSISRLKTLGVKAIILGCTELPILHSWHDFDSEIDWVDPMDIVASESVKIAKHNFK